MAEMTLEDLVNKIDWSFSDDDYEKYLEKLNTHLAPEDDENMEDFRRRSREALVDGALHMKVCKQCQFRGIRSHAEPYEEYVTCPMCGTDLHDDWDSRTWARSILGSAWDQAQHILQSSGLVTA